MKRALFRLLAGLVSLSLAGCTLSLIATPTPSPTPLVSTPTAFPAPTETPHIPIPDTIIDEVGAPTEIKQFAGSAESLQPMIDAIAKQLGFTPVEGELAGFTVTGAKGEGSYFFVSHEGTVYTLFAHAEGGRFATVKVDGAGKTSDFAIFKMTRFDRDAATVWWGIDDGQGGIVIPPMFEFQLNGDGSIAEVMFVEPKSGKSIQVSENTNQIQFESKALFKLQEPLGGSEVAHLYDGQRIPMPEGVKALLTPSSPDTWNQTGWYFTDGTPYPWGEPIVVGSDDQPLLVIPSFVRGVVEIPEPLGHSGGKRIFVVLEVPAHGGSNFVILNLQDNIYATRATIGISRLVDGKVPLNWAQSSWGNPISYEDLSPGYTFTGYFNGRQIADEFKQYIGLMVMVSFRTTAGYVGSLSLQQVVEGMLIKQNGQSGVDAIIPPVSIFFPYQSP